MTETEVDLTALNQDQAAPAPAVNTPPPPPPAAKLSEEQKIEVVADAMVTSRRTITIKTPPGQKFVDGTEFTFSETYTMRPMSIMSQFKFNKFLKQILNRILADDNSVDFEKVKILLPESQSNSLEAIMQVVSQAVEHLPEILIGIFQFGFAIPSNEMPYVEAIMDLPPREDGSGGVTKDEGLAIIDDFISQNGQAISDFFRKDAMGLGRKLQGVISPTKES